MRNIIIKIIGLLLLVQIMGCTPKPSPEANSFLVAEALGAKSDSKVAKLYIVVEDSQVMFGNFRFEVNNAFAGEIGENQYLYLKFDEGSYKILSIQNWSSKDTTNPSTEDESEIKYLAKPGSVDIISCPMSHFLPEKYPHLAPKLESEFCQIRPFDKNTAKIKGMSLRVGDVSHFGEEFSIKPTDYEYFKKVKMENTIAAYRDYLKRYPNAEYRKSAERAIQLLKK